MAVDVGGDRDAGVAEDLRDHGQRHAVRQRQRRRGVSQGVQADARQARPTRGALRARSAFLGSQGSPTSGE